MAIKRLLILLLLLPMLACAVDDGEIVDLDENSESLTFNMFPMTRAQMQNTQVYMFRGGAWSLPFDYRVPGFTSIEENAGEATFTMLAKVGPWYPVLVHAEQADLARLVQPHYGDRMGEAILWHNEPGTDGFLPQTPEIMTSHVDLVEVLENAESHATGELVRNVARVRVKIVDTYGMVLNPNEQHYIRLDGVPTTLRWDGGLWPSPQTPAVGMMGVPVEIFNPGEDPESPGNPIQTSSTAEFIIPAHKGYDWFSTSPVDITEQRLMLHVDFVTADGMAATKSAEIDIVPMMNTTLDISVILIPLEKDLTVTAEILPWEEEYIDTDLGPTVIEVDKTMLEMSWRDTLTVRSSAGKYTLDPSTGEPNYTVRPAPGNTWTKVTYINDGYINNAPYREDRWQVETDVVGYIQSFLPNYPGNPTSYAAGRTGFINVTANNLTKKIRVWQRPDTGTISVTPEIDPTVGANMYPAVLNVWPEQDPSTKEYLVTRQHSQPVAPIILAGNDYTPPPGNGIMSVNLATIPGNLARRFNRVQVTDVAYSPHLGLDAYTQYSGGFFANALDLYIPDNDPYRMLIESIEHEDEDYSVYGPETIYFTNFSTLETISATVNNLYLQVPMEEDYVDSDGEHHRDVAVIRVPGRGGSITYGQDEIRALGGIAQYVLIDGPEDNWVVARQAAVDGKLNLTLDIEPYPEELEGNRETTITIRHEGTTNVPGQPTYDKTIIIVQDPYYEVIEPFDNLTGQFRITPPFSGNNGWQTVPDIDIAVMVYSDDNGKPGESLLPHDSEHIMDQYLGYYSSYFVADHQAAVYRGVLIGQWGGDPGQGADPNNPQSSGESFTVDVQALNQFTREELSRYVNIYIYSWWFTGFDDEHTVDSWQASLWLEYWKGGTLNRIQSSTGALWTSYIYSNIGGQNMNPNSTPVPIDLGDAMTRRTAPSGPTIALITDPNDGAYRILRIRYDRITHKALVIWYNENDAANWPVVVETRRMGPFAAPLRQAAPRLTPEQLENMNPRGRQK